MNGQILKQTEFPIVGRNAFLKQTKSKLFPLVLACLVLAGAGNVRADDLHVPADYATIQAAVDAASSGDTIHIAPGVYTEQTTITDKDLTLIGRPGAILRAYADMELSFPEYSKWWVGILGVHRADVTVSGLTFEGERLGSLKEWDIKGIFFLGAGGRVEDCRFTGFRGSTLSSNPFCRGIELRNPVSLGTDVVDIQVRRCTFADNSFSMILWGDNEIQGQTIYDPTLLRTTISVCDNTIIGNGPDRDEQRGIDIEAGVKGEVKRNLITDYSWLEPNSDPTAVAIGLFAYGNSLHIEGNILRNNQVHSALLYAGDSVVMNNSFEGTAPGVRHAGLAFSGEDVVVANNRFSDMETGVILFGGDPDFLDVGTASNVTLLDNGFCDVDTNYDLQPLATYDLQSTLTCPEPVLDMVQAILLSWPFASDGYLVESADSPDGPWTTLDAKVFQQVGMHYVIVPSDGAPEFFRLVKP